VKCLLTVALFLLTGCVVQQPGRHIIIGFGIVGVPETNAVAQVTKIRAVGAYFGGGVGPQFSLGYVNSTLTAIQDSATNVVIEVK
jgi:hypothetical protein